VTSTIGTHTVVGITLTNAGTGYRTEPTVTIVDSHVTPGIGATAYAVVSKETTIVNIDLPATGVTAGSYGDAGTASVATNVPRYTVDAYGRLTASAEEAVVANWATLVNKPTLTVNLARNLTGSGTVNFTDTGNLSMTVNAEFVDSYLDAGNTGTAITPNFDNGSVQKYIANSNFTLNAATGMVAGQSMTLIIQQDGTGSKVMTANAAYKFAVGFKTLSTTANAIDLISIFYDGTTYYSVMTTGYA